MSDLRLAHPKRIDEAIPANMASGVTKPEEAKPSGAEWDSWAPIDRTASGVPVVSPCWVDEHASELRIIDVREHVEFCGPLGHIEGAELFPLSRIETACATWNRNESIIVVCAYGTRSGKAAVLLGAGGFRKVASLNGGMTRWAAEGDPRTQIMGDRAIEDAASWQAMGI